jgi:hypothetical protein
VRVSLTNGIRLGVRLEWRKDLLVLREQTRRDMRAVARADMRITAVQIESVKSWDRVLEQLRIVLRMEEG